MASSSSQSQPQQENSSVSSTPNAFASDSTKSSGNEYQQYNALKQECNQLISKILELEMDRNEHLLVEETLRPLTNKNRRAYRLVGEILVERTVEEVLPSVATNRENMDQSIKILRERLDQQEKKAIELKTKYNIQD